MENYERIVNEIKTVIKTRQKTERGDGSLAEIVKACEILDPEFNRAFSAGMGVVFDEKGNLTGVDGFGVFKHLNYQTSMFVGENLIQVDGSLMDDKYEISFVRDNKTK